MPTISGAILGIDLLFTDATYDIGKSGATRPRDLFTSRNAAVGGTLAVTGATTLTGALAAQGGATVQAGASTTYAKPALVLYQNGGLTRTATTDGSLASFSLPANALSVDGQTLRILVRGHMSSATNTAGPPPNMDHGGVNVVFGGTTIAATGVPLDTTGTSTAQWTFWMEIMVRRTGATAQRATTYLWASSDGAANNPPGPSYNRYTPAETLSGAVTIDFRGQAANGDLTDGTLTIDQILVEHLST